MTEKNRIEIIGRVNSEKHQIRKAVEEDGVTYRLIWKIAQYQGKDECAFWKCVMFGNLAYLEKESMKLQKGHLVYVIGKVIQKSNKTEVHVDTLYYFDRGVGKPPIPKEYTRCDSQNHATEELSHDSDQDNFKDDEGS